MILGVVAGLVSLVGVQAADPGAGSFPWVTPEKAVMAAAEKSPRGYQARFGMTVQATGRSRRTLYLNSEKDYRDPRNLSIAIDPQAQRSLQEQLQTKDLEAYFKGKTIVVDGVARTTKIGIFDDDRKPTGLYYYQTHVRVGQAGQIGVVEISR